MCSRNHLFFECSLSSRLWKAGMARCNLVDPPSFREDVLRLGCSNWKKKALLDTLCRLVLSSSIYNLWRARNEIKHSDHPKIEEQILKAIFWEVCAPGSWARANSVWAERIFFFVMLGTFVQICLFNLMLFGFCSWYVQVAPFCSLVWVCCSVPDLCVFVVFSFLLSVCIFALLNEILLIHTKKKKKENVR